MGAENEGEEMKAKKLSTRIPDGTPVVYWPDTGPVQLIVEKGVIVGAALVDNQDAPPYVRDAQG